MERSLTHIALFAALIAVLGLVPKIDLMAGVPITAQSLGIMLCGTVLGAKRGALAVLLFLLLVAAGLPLLSGGRGGLGVFAGPSVGYLLGFPVAAFVAGWIVERWSAPPWHRGLRRGLHRRHPGALRLRHPRHGTDARQILARGCAPRHTLPRGRSDQGRPRRPDHPRAGPDAPRCPALPPLTLPRLLCPSILGVRGQSPRRYHPSRTKAVPIPPAAAMAASPRPPAVSW